MVQQMLVPGEAAQGNGLHADDVPAARHCTPFHNTAAQPLLLHPSVGQSKRFVLRDIDQAWGDLHILKQKQFLGSVIKKAARWVPVLDFPRKGWEEDVKKGFNWSLEGPAGRSAESQGWGRRYSDPLLLRLSQPSSTESCLPFLGRNPEPQH